jgi:formylglycine-generating enzyme required for sulfatase activity
MSGKVFISYRRDDSSAWAMGGNLWQWCEDWYNAQEQYRVLRGASWGTINPGNLLASSRRSFTPDYRLDTVGFRCVLAVASSR